MGDIIRIAYVHHWAGCLAEVNEVKPWGVQAFVLVPQGGMRPPAQVFARLPWGDFAILLRAGPPAGSSALN